MESDRIDKLLDKYFEATTTAAEDSLLREYFAQEAVAPHLQAYIPMFRYFSKAREEQYTGHVPPGAKRTLYSWISVAAVAVLLCGIYFGNYYEEQRKAEYAYNQTKLALHLLAENLDRGTEKVAYLKEFEETKQKIYKDNN